jgi:glycosyltransferase involved in cell wall biosynthesis
MNVALLTHEPFYPPSGGGSAEALYLVRELVRRRHGVHVFGPQLHDAPTVEERFGVRLHGFTAWRMGRYARCRNLKYLLYPFLLERMVRRRAAQCRPDVIVSQHAISAVSAGRLRAALGVPVVMNFLDYLTGFMETWPPLLMPPPLLKRLKRFELNLPLRYLADGVLTVSDTLADYFAQTGYPRARLRPMYYGYDAEAFPFQDPLARDPATAPIVVMHGSFDQHHLGPIARAALAHVARKRPEVRFRFVGKVTGVLRAFLDSTASATPPPVTECAGFVPYETVARHLADATVGIVPYESSTGVHCAFVAKIVEYMATGLPVVSTRLDSAQRYFADEPMIRFAGFDGPGFGEAILDWLAEPREKWRPAARRASDRVRQELDWPRLCARAVDFIEQTAAQRGKA